MEKLAIIKNTLNVLQDLQRGMNQEKCEKVFAELGLHIATHIWHEFRKNNHTFPLSKFDLNTMNVLSKYLDKHVKES